MTFFGWFYLSWVDEFLILSKDTESLLIPRERVWHPDMSILESVQDPQTLTDGKHVLLFQNGIIMWLPGNEYVIKCTINIQKYPFDEQTCDFRVTAWQNTAWTQRLVVNEENNGFDTTQLTDNGEWLMTGTQVKSHVDPTYNVSMIKYSIYLKRRPLHPVVSKLLPIIMLAFMNTLVFLLPANSGEKITLCISVLLSFTVFMTVFDNTMPEMSTSIAYLSIYLLVQLGMSVVAIITTIIIWRLKDKEKAEDHDSNSFPFTENDKNDVKRALFSKVVVKRLCLPLCCHGNQDGSKDATAVGENYSIDSCQGQQTGLHMSSNIHGNNFRKDDIQNNAPSTPKLFSLTRRQNFDEAAGKTTKLNWGIAIIDNAMFLVTFCIYIVSTIFLFIALLV
ncbi:neuronal acetylcholine receptor subunit non-alpha-2-like [Argopecten irradians]|uniref:neuronal acetylcholine receptor subunit non-alpha-2-like n=1 Tax=Argopecten irradians TaxID=31199 RepID=UPI0037160B7B